MPNTPPPTTASNLHLIALLRLCLLLLLPLTGHTALLSLPASEQPVLPAPFMQVWQDPEGQTQIATLRSLPDSAWQAVARRDASFGYGGQTYWLRLKLHNPETQAMDWVLLIGNPLLDYLDAYGLDGERLFIHNELHRSRGLRKLHLETARLGAGLQILTDIGFDGAVQLQGGTAGGDKTIVRVGGAGVGCAIGARCLHHRQCMRPHDKSVAAGLQGDCRIGQLLRHI